MRSLACSAAAKHAPAQKTKTVKNNFWKIEKNERNHRHCAKHTAWSPPFWQIIIISVFRSGVCLHSNFLSTKMLCNIIACCVTGADSSSSRRKKCFRGQIKLTSFRYAISFHTEFLWAFIRILGVFSTSCNRNVDDHIIFGAERYEYVRVIHKKTQHHH